MPTSGSTLESYLADKDARGEPIVRALDRVITGVRPDLDVAVKYKILMYALHGDWRRWVCAIDARRDRVCLRFLYGVLLDDPRRILRGGTSVLMTWDFAFGDAVDPAAVGAYVAEAVARYDEYKANEGIVLSTSRAAAKRKRGTKAGA